MNTVSGVGDGAAYAPGTTPPSFFHGRGPSVAAPRAQQAGTKRTKSALAFFELANVLLHFDHVASRIVNADHSVMWAAEKPGVIDCVAGCFWTAIPHRTIGKRITD